MMEQSASQKMAAQESLFVRITVRVLLALPLFSSVTVRLYRRSSICSGLRLMLLISRWELSPLVAVLVGVITVWIFKTVYWASMPSGLTSFTTNRSWSCSLMNA